MGCEWVFLFFYGAYWFVSVRERGEGERERRERGKRRGEEVEQAIINLDFKCQFNVKIISLFLPSLLLPPLFHYYYFDNIYYFLGSQFE